MPSSRIPGGWIVAPWFDLLFLANLAWVVLLIPGLVDSGRSGPIDFIQIYFLTTPHRWITLFLVALDPDRRSGRGRFFLGLAVIVTVAVLTLRLSTNAFLCLVLIDFVWNAWHFGSQHAGVARIYGRKAGAAPSTLEKQGMRFLVVYAILRIPEWSAGGLPEAWRAWLPLADSLALTVPALILTRTLLRPNEATWGRLAYLTSVCLLYSAMILTQTLGRSTTMNALFLAAALFHAIEYLAIVTHYARGRAERGTACLFQRMARHWTVVLLLYLTLWGMADWMLHHHFFEWAAGLNLGAAFLHYTYDGMIWKLRRPETARSLGV
ncbi:hypothetical protein Isop_2056 [Isosphaera pallida ATCC 43644]|uniref:Uncharacterized protein n=1 Tax=Isosphaera pallida (strain ATCC 43644 / DSM 9630 / IS1B) TaxID=575540 RepID=E8R3Q1_ISOPI|nr:hypothetical protein [Isosphaera pallida]ADV62636.1 hypothetical protein Isop_2056 [Isosphaera pallida ATCC 43644]